MKLLRSFAIYFFSCMGSILYGQTIFDDNRVFSISYEYVLGCETGEGPCIPIHLKRFSIEENLFLVLPSAGTQTDVYLFSEADFVKMREAKIRGEIKPILHETAFGAQNKQPTFNLKGIADGSYRVWLMACHLGGTFVLHIETLK